MVRKLFITPDGSGEGVVTRCLHVPASQQWLAVFNAALLLMADPENYEQLSETSLSPDEVAATMYGVYEDWLTGDCSVNCLDVQACLPEYTDATLRDGTFNVNVVDPNDATVIETRFPQAARDGQILPPPANCDLDEMWAGILEIVTRIDGNGRDFWENVVAKTDRIDRIAEIIALVPLFGDIVGEGLQILADIAPDMLDLYDSYSSQSQIEAIACDLFQTVCSECRYPTYQEVFDYYAGRSALGETQWMNIAFDAIVDVLLGTSGASPGIVYMTTNILQIWVLSAAAQWVSTLGVKFIALWAGLGASVPSSGWELLCGSCGNTWSHEFLGGSGADAWVALQAPIADFCTAVYNGVDDRFEGCLPNPYSGRFVILERTFSAAANITKIQMDYAFRVTRNTNGDYARIEAPAGTTLANRDYFGTLTGTGTLTFEGNIEVGAIRLTNITGANTAGDGGYSYITRILVEGVGYDPFV